MASTPRPFALAPPPAIFQQRRVDVLLSLQQAAQQIASILELDELLDTIVHRIAVDFGCIESSILLVDGDEFHLAAVHGCTQSNKGERWPVTEGYFQCENGSSLLPFTPSHVTKDEYLVDKVLHRLLRKRS